MLVGTIIPSVFFFHVLAWGFVQCSVVQTLVVDDVIVVFGMDLLRLKVSWKEIELI
jgi:hypothetical protein